MTSGAVHLRRVVMACEGYRAAIDAVFGIGLTESQTLSQLAVHGELSPSELGEKIGLTSGSITNVLDRLEAAGLVRRRPHPADRRRLIVSATDGSRAIIAASDEQYAAVLATVMAAEPHDVESVISALADAFDAATERLDASTDAEPVTAGLTTTGRG